MARTRTTTGTRGSDPRPQVRVMFCITGNDLDLDRISELAGIEPTDRGRQGDLAPGRRFPVPDTFWSIELESRGYILDEPVAELLGSVLTRRDGIRLALEGTEAEVTVVCAVVLTRDGVDFSLSAGTVAQLAELGAGFSIDIVDLRKSR